MQIRSVLFLIVSLLFSVRVFAATSMYQEVTEGFDYRVNQLFYLTKQRPVDTAMNPGNTIFCIPDHVAALEFRPDFSIFYKSFDISVKPRLDMQWTGCAEECFRAETRGDVDLFINEWLLRVQAGERFFVSYGRENLQWGPAWLFSPSNPFFRNNGRTNPKIELPGMDFARLIYLPNMTWTVSLIANLDEGRNQLKSKGEFKKTYTAKVDLTGEETYSGVILSNREQGNTSVGGFGGWTFSDAILLYTDFNISTIVDDSYWPQFALVAGAAYTLETGPTFTVEYAYQKNSSEFSKRNNVLLQYSQNEILDILNIVIRITGNLDDESAQLITITEYLTGDHMQFFLNTTINSGSEGKEFGDILDYQIMIGMEYSF